MQLLPKKSTPPEQEAEYIRQWSKLITAGWGDFTRELLWERSKANPKPLVFAVITQRRNLHSAGPRFWHHSIGYGSTPKQWPARGFLGDRVITEFQGKTIIQEPQFVMLLDKELITGVPTKSVADGAIKKLGKNGGLLKGSPKASSALVPIVLPLPLAWVPYFLEKKIGITPRHIVI